MTLFFRSLSCKLGGTSAVSPPNPSAWQIETEEDEEREDELQEEIDEFEPISTPFITPEERENGGGSGRGGGGQSPILASVAAALRKSLLVTCSVEREDVDISCPTNVRHISHVTFDRFHGFLGLPLELQPEVPRRVPCLMGNMGVCQHSGAWTCILVWHEQRTYVQYIHLCIIADGRSIDSTDPCCPSDEFPQNPDCKSPPIKRRRNCNYEHPHNNKQLLRSVTLARLEFSPEQKHRRYQKKYDDHERNPYSSSSGGSSPVSSMATSSRYESGEIEGILDKFNLRKRVKKLRRHPVFQLSRPSWCFEQLLHVHFFLDMEGYCKTEMKLERVSEWTRFKTSQ